MSNDDFYDAELENALRSRAGSTSATDTAHAAVLDRASSIRRRRGAFAGGGALVALAVGGFVLLSGGSDRIGSPADGVQLPPVTPLDVDASAVITVPDGLSDPSSTTTVADTSVPDTSVVAPTTEPVGDAPLPIDDSGDDSAAVSTSTSRATVPSTTSGAEPLSTSPVVTTKPPPTTVTTSTTLAPPTSSSSSSTTEPPLAPFTETYTSPGGSITVHWNGSALSLSGITPAAGSTAEIEDDQADRIRVRFRGEQDSRIEVRISNGQKQVTIS